MTFSSCFIPINVCFITFLFNNHLKICTLLRQSLDCFSAFTQSLFSRMNRPYNGFLLETGIPAWLYLQKQPSLGLDHAIYLWLFITELWELYKPKHALLLCSIPNQTFSSQLVTLTGHFLKGSAESSFYWQTKWNNSFTLFPQVSIVSCYFPLTLVIFLVTRVLRNTFCFPALF